MDISFWTRLSYDLVCFHFLAIIYWLQCLYRTIIPFRFRTKKTLRNQLVLITGAAGGLGQSLARKFAQHGAKLILWDVNFKDLISLKDKLNGAGFSEIFVFKVDVSNREQVYETAAKIAKTIGHVNVLVNNAAIVYGDLLQNLPDEEIERAFQVNILSHFWTVKAFLPAMIDSKTGSGHIVTIASMAGLLGVYKCTDYCATKFANIGFHESLYIELKTLGHTNIDMTLVCPYILNTGLFAGARPRLLPKLEPDQVADRVVRAVQLREAVVVLPTISRFLLPLKFLLPEKLCWELLYRLEQGPRTMQNINIKKHVS